MPGIGQHDANKYLPYLASLFLFIFTMNLVGLVPFMGSPTAAITVTGALALVSFVVIHVSGVSEMGTAKYLKTFIPHIHIEGGTFMQLFAWVLKVGMAMLEYLTAFIRATVLAVRLFANMLAGHTVLFMILFFIQLVSHPDYQIAIVKSQSSTTQGVMWFVMSVFSVALVTALTLLELFIAGLAGVHLYVPDRSVHRTCQAPAALRAAARSSLNSPTLGGFRRCAFPPCCSTRFS